jgi:hypothetical protein
LNNVLVANNSQQVEQIPDDQVSRGGGANLERSKNKQTNQKPSTMTVVITTDVLIAIPPNGWTGTTSSVSFRCVGEGDACRMVAE